MVMVGVDDSSHGGGFIANIRKLWSEGDGRLVLILHWWNKPGGFSKWLCRSDSNMNIGISTTTTITTILIRMSLTVVLILLLLLSLMRYVSMFCPLVTVVIDDLKSCRSTMTSWRLFDYSLLLPLIYFPLTASTPFPGFPSFLQPQELIQKNYLSA